MNKKILILTVCLACAVIFMGPECLAQIQTGVWRTPSNNTDYHHFTRNGGGAAVYINQESTAANYPILRLSSGSVGANTNVRFTVENNGRVGIGTMTPTGKLEINGTGTIGGYWNPNNSFLSISQGGNSLIMDHNEIYSTSAINLGSKSGDIIQFRAIYESSSSTKVVIKRDGKVGIGTQTPNSKLSVNGNIRAQEIKLEATNWPDYVFGENYRQPGLEELEVFIKANGHLPGLKSAKEYQEEGVDIMELNQKLLEKIEELTLYIIQQDEKIDQQNEQHHRQSEEISQLKREIQTIKELLLEK